MTNEQLLAGISIQAVTNTGLFKNAQKASLESKYANAEEKVKLAVMASYDESGALNKEILKENVNKIDGLGTTVETITYPLEIQVDEFSFIIEEYGIIKGI